MMLFYDCSCFCLIIFLLLFLLDILLTFLLFVQPNPLLTGSVLSVFQRSGTQSEGKFT